MVYMFWDECVDGSFYRHTCQKDNFMYLNGNNILYPRAAEIVWEYIEKDEKNIEKMKKSLISNGKIFQYVYSKCYPVTYSLVEKRGIDLRGEFLLTFKAWRDKRKSFYRQPQLEAFEQKEKINTTEEKVNDDIEIENVEKEVVEKNKQEKMGKNWWLKKSREGS